MLKLGADRKGMNKQNTTQIFENYPWWTVILCNLVPLGTYVIGGIITYKFGLVWFLVYLVYICILEITFYSKACVYCCYYGKWCAFGKGKVASLLFKKKDSKKFCQRQIKPINLLPDMLVVFVPVVLGVVLLIREFSWLVLTLIVLDIFLISYGNSLVRGKLACPHCAQGKICCPARDMFSRIQKNN